MDYQKIVFPVLREAGEELRKGFGKAEIIQEKGDLAVDVVTALDRKTEEFLATKLRAADPSADFYGEENGGHEDGERFWVCDPIDGTAHFIRGLPFCTTMLCLIENGQVVFSAIYDFVKDDIYWAEKGKGAWRNDDPIHVSKRTLQQAYLSFETHEDNPQDAEKLHALRKRCILVNTISAGFEYAMVACGKLEGRITFDPYGKVWDYASGPLLVEEAGGVAVNIGKESYDYRNFDVIATNPVIYKELTEGEHAIFPIR
ncbi:MAG TPA: hypothetical protein DIS53_00755 [Candidatus Wildermuthbacteria bacterium]|uniref:Inositol monophosphatase n=1 Tax=Candidatus Yanofskybacteria bacterium GW2011_GWC1_48_11 TaxID=1619027 RepID=A0A837ISE8_9BACT|nr:MAG: Inositol monophosphatase [Candidatus Yanofskybacteria bacterium GW2011_GWC1_48_11]KKW04128.1 MAG: Inositol monophosphatase [Parcubacteria group bacterium GW2011_GWB1_49_12]KKW08403.1 MAG: Inositol monophosphatase [Parcubacteria group bacterium GW2011_GWA1_49_26]KKW14332.1 MAG: Inositol monophosphatase [Parcubacteria group bacterium GW2011_GWA2_50_10]OHA61176.1 MAG: hypothetical protein A2109_01540 [Candidatus Wildermuthbacteria bacterium GWA1_49_26]OHA65527.1 MAG: hypothetical protein 